MNATTPKQSWRSGIAAFAVLALLSHCESLTISEKGGTAPRVLIEAAASHEEVAAACDVVMGENGYKIVEAHGNSLLYEKKASRMANLAWSNWTQEGTWERVSLRIRPSSEGGYSIDCVPSLVTNRDSGFEDSHAVPRSGRGKYVKLMQEIRARFS